MRDGAVDVVDDVGGADAVVEEVEDGAVGAIDGHESSLDEVPVLPGEVRNVGVSVLEPSVEDEPAVGDDVGTEIESSHVEETELNRPGVKEAEHADDADVRKPHLLLPHSREELGVLVASRKRLDGDEVVGHATNGSTSDSSNKVCRPSKDEVRNDAVGTIDRFSQLLAEDLLHCAQLAKSTLASLQGVGDVGLALEDVVRL
mmetsp:Transcript_45848/g.143853  ORF Transcript_45848/g.143853 Transcript_45848/m.143853 type:complete len:202 (+) Transcript_45848:267-872(+)